MKKTLIKGWPVERRISGVYALVYQPTGCVYIGSSARCVYNRITHHMTLLRRSLHSNELLQEEWNNSVPQDWRVVVLEKCNPALVKEQESYWLLRHGDRYNQDGDATGRGRKLSPLTKQKQSEARARYLETPGARECLVRKARKQHATGNLGAATWKQGPDYKAMRDRLLKKNAEDNRKLS